MRIATVSLESIAPYSQSRIHDTPKKDKERPDDYEIRTWREKAHTNTDGTVFIPAMSFKMCLDEAAKMLGKQIVGKGKSTYTKHFARGVLVPDHLKLAVKKDDLQPETINANSDGVRGSGKRVKRTFPTIPSWKGKVTFVVMDDTITKDIFQEHLEAAGQYIGIGRFRAGNGGMYGRFKINKIDWQNN